MRKRYAATADGVSARGQSEMGDLEGARRIAVLSAPIIPVVTSTNETLTTVFYPLSPDRCFVAGPALAEELPQIVPDGRSVTDAQRAAVNRLMASFARKSVIASPQANDMALRAELEPVLGQRWLALSRARRFLPEHWGDLV
jgi:hypothetical protein